MVVNSLSHQQLLQALAAEGDTNPAWEEFVRRFRQRIALTAIRAIHMESRLHPDLDSGPVAELAEDISQDVFARLLVKNAVALSRFQGRHEFSLLSYLNTITVNLVRDHFKMLGRKKRPSKRVHFTSPDGESVDLDEILPSEEPSPERRVISKRLSERIEACFREGVASDGRDRMVFRLFFCEGLSLSEIAEIPTLKLSRRAVERRVSELRGRLKERLASSNA